MFIFWRIKVQAFEWINSFFLNNVSTFDKARVEASLHYQKLHVRWDEIIVVFPKTALTFK